MRSGRRSAIRVPLKGLNRNRKRLKNGQYKTYYYAWKGGPPLPGNPGSAEFMAAYYAAIEKRASQPKDTMKWLLTQYSLSPEFGDLAMRTRKDYARHLLRLEQDFGDLPILALEDRRIRGDFLAWRDQLAVSSRRQGDYAYAVLARVLSWSRNRGLIAVNPCERGGRLYRAARSERIWTKADEAAFRKAAPPHLALAISLAIWTGQRQGDLLALTWAQYDGEWIRLKQGKTGMRQQVPVAAKLKSELDKALEQAREADPDHWEGRTILVTKGGKAWTDGGFRASWRKACIAAGISGLSFHDLRGTAVTRLAEAECTVPQIASITGHSLKDVGSILDAHYLHRSNSLAQSAIRKLEGT